LNRLNKIPAVATRALFWLLLVVCVSIPRPLASAKGGNCEAAEGVLDNFSRTLPPRPVTDKPFTDKDGRLVTLSQYRGRGVVLNFWATWCAPCVLEMPQLDRLRKILLPYGVEVLALSEDRGGVPVAEKFYRKKGLKNLGIFIDSGGKVIRGSKILGLPTTLLIDRQGQEVGRVTGVAEWDSDRTIAFIRRCLKP